jgi:hypothetical protein
MSLAAIFVFLLVSAVQMLECVLDLARRVGATNVLFLFLSQIILMRRKD